MASEFGRPYQYVNGKKEYFEKEEIGPRHFRYKKKRKPRNEHDDEEHEQQSYPTRKSNRMTKRRGQILGKPRTSEFK